MIPVGNNAVSIHAPVKGATFRHLTRCQNEHSFNPRAREGRDGVEVAHSRQRREVSIHAPVKGATIVKLGVLRTPTVSIHAPVKGATGCNLRPRPIICCFNPRAREGRDPNILKIGIFDACFNPRAREGRDDTYPANLINAYLFQSTRP